MKNLIDKIPKSRACKLFKDNGILTVKQLSVLPDFDYNRMVAEASHQLRKSTDCVLWNHILEYLMKIMKIQSYHNQNNINSIHYQYKDVKKRT